MTELWANDGIQLKSMLKNETKSNIIQYTDRSPGGLKESSQCFVNYGVNTMDNEFYRPIIEHLPFSYAYHRIICDASGIPCDYIFLEVNPAFEETTRLKAGDVIGRKASEVLADTKEDHFDWIAYYGEIALNGGSREFIRHAEGEDSWFKVKVYSPKKYYFITLVSDISESMRPLNELDLYFNISPDLLCICDLKGLFLKVNSAWQTTMGYGREELEDKGFWSFVHPGDRDVTMEATTRLLKEYKITDFVNRYLCKNGSYKHIEWACQRYGDKIYAVARDVTERREMEHALKAERSLTDAVFDSVPGILYLYDEKRRLLRWNERHEQMTGYSAAEMDGKSLLDWFKGDRKSMAAVASASRNTIRTGHGETEAKMQCKDGRKIDMYFTATMLDVDGKPYFTGIGIDISNIKKAENSLVESKERLQAILMSVGDAVITTDGSGRVELMNFIAEELTGWKQDEAIGRRLEEVFRVFKRDREKDSVDIFRQATAADRPAAFGGDMIMRSKSGIERTIENTAAPILDKNGGISGAVFVFRDSSEKLDKLKQIEYLSYHDALTGLFNRRFYEEEIKRLDTERNLPISVIMGDINRLKLINDAFGHAKGDELLKKAAGAIQRGCRSEDLIARWGGDEFIVFLPRTTLEEAHEVAERITELCGEEEVNSIAVSISFGIASKFEWVEDFDDIMRRAEDNMYSTKMIESEAARSDIIKIITKTLYQRNPELEKHARRVSALCVGIGKAMGFSTIEIARLESGGMLHDIGKIALDPGLLEKQGRLTPTEWDELRQHAAIGYRIVSSARDMIGIGEAILSHHEHWDGSGYPKGLKGEAIPVHARIIAIADSYDSMTNGYIFDGPVEKGKAVEELRKNKGAKFDPEITELFINEVLK